MIAGVLSDNYQEQLASTMWFRKLLSRGSFCWFIYPYIF